MPRLIDHTNKIYGKLTALCEAVEMKKPDGRVVWKCKCECNNLVYRAAQNFAPSVNNKRVLSCLECARKKQSEVCRITMSGRRRVEYVKKTCTDCKTEFEVIPSQQYSKSRCKNCLDNRKSKNVWLQLIDESGNRGKIAQLVIQGKSVREASRLVGISYQRAYQYVKRHRQVGSVCNLQEV